MKKYIYIPTELWRFHPTHTGIEVSSLGRVRNWNFRGSVLFEPRYLSPYITTRSGGYQFATVTTPKGPVKIAVLVLETFVGLRPHQNWDCCHNDGDSLNNSILNLRWDTKKNNQRDRIRHGTSPQGSRNGRAILTSEIVNEIRLPNNMKLPAKALAERFGVSETRINLIQTNKSWHDPSFTPRPRKRILDKDKVLEVLFYLNNSDKTVLEIADILGLSFSIVNSIKFRTKYRTICNEYYVKAGIACRWGKNR